MSTHDAKVRKARESIDNLKSAIKAIEGEPRPQLEKELSIRLNRAIAAYAELTGKVL